MNRTRKNYILALFVLAVLAAIFYVDQASFGQTNMGAMTSPQVNATFYVGTSPYFTIQSAVTKVCAGGSGKGQVTINANFNPSDTPAGTAGCAGVPIFDQRTQIVWLWNTGSSVYQQQPAGTLPVGTGVVAVTGGSPGLASGAQIGSAFNCTGGVKSLQSDGSCAPSVTPPSPAFAVPFTNSGVNGFGSDVNFLFNPSKHDLEPQSVNSNQSVGVGTINTNIQNTYNNATASNTALGAMNIPANYSGSDALTLPSTLQAVADILIGNGTNGTIGTIISVTPLILGEGYNCAALPSYTLTTATSGTPAVITPNCVSEQITSYTITNPGTGYPQNFPIPQLVMGLPPANPTFNKVDLRQGPQAYHDVIRVDDYGCKGDGFNGTGTDNTSCINQAIAAAVAIAAAHQIGQPAISFTPGGRYNVNSTPFNELAGGDDGSAPQAGTCNGGGSCVALAPLPRAQVPCSVKLPGNLIIYGNNSALAGPTGAGAYNKTTMFCGAIGDTTIYDLSIGGISFGIVTPQMFNLELHGVSFNIVDAGIIAGISDRISTFDNVSVTGFAGVVVGGWYQCRGPLSPDGGQCSESGGYFDGQRVSKFTFNNMGDFAEAPNTNPRYPDGCTGTVPSGHVNGEHALDEWFNSLFFKSCISGSFATNTTAISGLTFQIYQPLVNQGIATGNNQTIQVDTTTNSADVFANAGTLTGIFVKDQFGNSRNLQQIANAINGSNFGGTSVGTGLMRVNITGDPTTVPSSSGPVPFTGGVNSSRLPDGQVQAEYRGITGMGLAFYSMWNRPSGGVQIGSLLTEFPIRYPVFIQGQVNALNLSGFASIESGWNCANHSAVVGSSTCPDPYNFFTPTANSGCAAPNAAAVYVLSGYGTVNAPSGFPFACQAVVVDPSITVSNGASQNTTNQPNKYVCNDPQAFLTTDSCFWDFTYQYRPNDSTNTSAYHTFLGHLVSEPGSGGSALGSGDLVYVPYGRPTGSGNNKYIGFRAQIFSFWNLTPANQGYNPDIGTFGVPTDPMTTEVNPSSIWYNSAAHIWKGYDGTNILRLQATPTSTSDGCSVFTSNVLGSTGSPCARVTFGTPASSSAACTAPTVEYDASFLYTCIATNTWTRVATATF